MVENLFVTRRHGISTMVPMLGKIQNAFDIQTNLSHNFKQRNLLYNCHLLLSMLLLLLLLK